MKDDKTYKADLIEAIREQNMAIAAHSLASVDNSAIEAAIEAMQERLGIEAYEALDVANANIMDTDSDAGLRKALEGAIEDFKLEEEFYPERLAKLRACNLELRSMEQRLGTKVYEAL